MENTFPEWRWFADPETGKFGFQGYIKGRFGRIYEVVLEARESTYPQQPPAIYMAPPIHGNHGNMLGDGQVCKVKTWNPALSTFASTVLDAIKYVKFHS